MRNTSDLGKVGLLRFLNSKRNDMEFERQWLANKHTFKYQNNITSSYFALKHSFLKVVLLAIPRKKSKSTGGLTGRELFWKKTPGVSLVGLLLYLWKS